MDAIKSISFSICITIVVTSIFSMLLPNTKLEKVIKFAISLFFLAGIISPFFNARLNFHVDVGELANNSIKTELSIKSEKQFSSIVESNLESSIMRILKKEKIPIIKVQVIINNLTSDDISISKLMIYINEDTQIKSDDINKIVKDEIGVSPTIVVQNNQRR